MLIAISTGCIGLFGSPDPNSCPVGNGCDWMIGKSELTISMGCVVCIVGCKFGAGRAGTGSTMDSSDGRFGSGLSQATGIVTDQPENPATESAIVASGQAKTAANVVRYTTVSYTHLTLPTIYSV